MENEKERFTYLKITIEQLKFLMSITKKNSFLYDFIDEVNGEPKIPSLFIGFPRGIEKQIKNLESMLKACKGEDPKKKNEEDYLGSRDQKKYDFQSNSDEEISFLSKEEMNKSSQAQRKSDNQVGGGTPKKKNEEDFPSKKINREPQKPAKEQKTSTIKKSDHEEAFNKPQKPKNAKKSQESSSLSSIESDVNFEPKPKLKKHSSAESDKNAKRKPKMNSDNSDKKSNGDRPAKKPSVVQNKFREEPDYVPPKVDPFSDDLNRSFIKDNSHSDSEDDEGFGGQLDMETRNIRPPPKGFEDKLERGLMKKFNLNEKQHFYLTHRFNKDVRRTIGDYVKKRNLKYYITDKCFFLEAEDSEIASKVLKETHQTVKNKLNELSFVEEELDVRDYHSFKKIFRASELKKKFEAVSFLNYHQTGNERATVLICYFETFKEKAREMGKFIQEREAQKISLIKVSYHKFEKGEKRQKMTERKDFHLLLDHGKLASRYFQTKSKSIASEMNKFNFFDNLSCKMCYFQSSKPEREYNNSIIFHWEKGLKYSNKDDAKRLDGFIKKVRQELYSKIRFCALVFKEIESQKYFPELPEKDYDCVWFSVIKISGLKYVRINIFGDPETIFSDFLESKNIRGILQQTVKHCNKMKCLLMDGQYSPDEEFYKFHKKFPKIIEETKRYKKDEKCNYLKILFKEDIGYDERINTLKEIINQGSLPRDRNRTEKMTFERRPMEEESKKSKREEPKQAKPEEKKDDKNKIKKEESKKKETSPFDYEVSDDDASQEDDDKHGRYY